MKNLSWKSFSCGFLFGLLFGLRLNQDGLQQLQRYNVYDKVYKSNTTTSKSNTPMSLENEPVVEKKFSYNVTNNKDCVKPQLIIGISKAIEELYEKHNIRVIPRTT